MIIQGPLSAGATAIYFTGGTFVATFSYVAFNDPNAAINVGAGALSGASRLTMRADSGIRTGSIYEADPLSVVDWPNNLPNQAPTGPSISATQVYPSSVSVTYGLVGANAYIVDASTASDFSGTLFTSSTTDTLAAGLSVFGLIANTTYYFRAGALWGGTTLYANTTPSSVVTAVNDPAPLTFTAISISGFTLGWQANANPGGTLYQATISTDVSFGAFSSSSATTATSAVFSGLIANTTYFARVRAVNSSGSSSGYASGVVVTSLGVVTISANRIPNVWYGEQSTSFNAQGAVSYRYRLTTVANDAPLGSDPLFDGSALTLTVPEGVYYFHVTGFSAAAGGGAFMGTAHFGPVEIDLTPAAILSVAAQISATDTTPISDGATTLATSPRITWLAPTSASPIVGYNVSVSTNAADVPGQAVLTTINFRDIALTSAGIYYVKVNALDAAGNWGPAQGTSFAFSTTPAAENLILKKNLFNPLLGQCATLNAQSAASGHMKVELYTGLGRKIMTLADQDIAPGSYTLPWCGKNSSGETVATGVYILHVELPSQKKNFKLGVVK